MVRMTVAGSWSVVRGGWVRVVLLCVVCCVFVGVFVGVCVESVLRVQCVCGVGVLCGVA